MNPGEILRRFSPKKIVIPIVIGLLVVAFLIYREYDAEAWAQINWNARVGWGILASIVCMLVRDLAYMYRIRVLTDYKLNWRQSFDVIMIWEFASAVTPSIVGGTGVALFVLTKEKISAGRSTAIVFLSAFFDELFFILMAPIVIFWVGLDNLFFSVKPEVVGEISSADAILGVFWMGYVIIFVYTVILAYGLFLNPKGFGYLVVKLFSIRFLRRWRHQAMEAARDIEVSSTEFKGMKFSFWVKNFVSTFFSWTGRYLVVNCLIWAFYSSEEILSVYNHIVIYARQVVMWVILLISPTPGGSGIAEVLFKQFLSDFCPDQFSGALAFLWRAISYFPYLIIGAIVFPKWAKKKIRISLKKSENKA